VFVEFNLEKAKDMYKYLKEQIKVDKDLQRMDSVIRAQYDRLVLNVVKYIAYLEDGIESLRAQNEYEVEKVLGFAFRRNSLFACAYVFVEWKKAAEYPNVIRDWIPYQYLRRGLLMNKWIKAELQKENSWVKDAVSIVPLELDQTKGANRWHEEIQKGII
jgi:hypothetical protein